MLLFVNNIIVVLLKFCPYKGRFTFIDLPLISFPGTLFLYDNY